MAAFECQKSTPISLMVHQGLRVPKIREQTPKVFWIGLNLDGNLKRSDIYLPGF